MNYTIFGESHGPAVGVVLTGVPAGLALDMAFIEARMALRHATSGRAEPDEVNFLSGVYHGKATGTPLCVAIKNVDAHPADYSALEHLPRPSHADFTAEARYGGSQDPRGGGHFSGRLTAPLVCAGAIAQLILRARGVEICSQISMLGGLVCPNPAEVKACIAAARAEGDSVGGTVRCTVSGLTAGLGAVDFGRNVEGIFSQHLFAIPGVKALGFGLGETFAQLRGSQANDAFFVDAGATVKTRTNHAGGVNGGITNGMPIVFDVTFRPTPSIAQAQETVNMQTKTAATITIDGRHDPCIALRGAIAVEAAAALASCELLGI